MMFNSLLTMEIYRLNLELEAEEKKRKKPVYRYNWDKQQWYLVEKYEPKDYNDENNWLSCVWEKLHSSKK